MPFCENEGINIYYEIDGSGSDLIMIHGFASDLEDNWKASGVAGALKEKNRLIMMDCRGHGKSDKPTDPEMYGPKMLDDIINLMDHLGIGKANFFGYSMGSRLSLNLLLTRPERFNSVILGGFVLPDPNQTDSDESLGPQRQNVVAEALLADNLEDVTNPVGKEFRRFAESRGGNLKALAAVMMRTAEDRSDPREVEESLKSISVPLMTLVGSDDFIPGDKARMAIVVPDACHFQIQGKDHLTVVPDPKFRMAAGAFLDYVNGR